MAICKISVGRIVTPAPVLLYAALHCAGRGRWDFSHPGLRIQNALRQEAAARRVDSHPSLKPGCRHECLLASAEN